MFVNEYRLNLSDAKARKMLEQEMENFFCLATGIQEA